MKQENPAGPPSLVLINGAGQQDLFLGRSRKEVVIQLAGQVGEGVESWVLSALCVTAALQINQRLLGSLLVQNYHLAFCSLQSLL